jgi:GH15 family glucan-1,4-alpha-glucosidase
MTAMASPIEDYALIGDLHTAALVDRRGSIDWLCLPHFDSAACFANLLGSEDNGFWRIAPAGGPGVVTEVRRRYREGTLVLETEFDTASGTVRLTDCMPIRETKPQVVRLVEGVRGTVDLRFELAVRFGYGDAIPWVTRCDGLHTMTAGPDAVALWSRVETHGENMRTVGDFSIHEGQQLPFILTWFQSHETAPQPADPWYVIEATDAWWRSWSSACTYRGDHADAVQRSLITLKALTYEPTGGIVAAPTTSLPEAIGGSRNWDYRYCWLRDATLTLEALMRGGYHDEALAWRDWLLRATAGDVSRLQIMYGPSGERRLDEWEVDWLSGYEGSSPVRVGNAASGQYQLDVYGEVMSALFTAAQADGVHSRAIWDLQVKLIEFVEEGWKLPDDGIWEVRGPRRHFTHSKVMAWVAVDRAVRTLEEWPELPGPLDRWWALRDEIHEEICAKGYSEEKQAFTQYYGCDELDASILMLPLVGFLPPDDPRVVSTVEAVERELMDGGFVLRYRTTTDGAVDGLTGREGAFLACSFWLVDCLHLIGREDDARALFERLAGLSNDLGLFSEEYDPVAGRLVGNFPQAFSHVSFVNSACRLAGGEPLTAEHAHATARVRRLLTESRPGFAGTRRPARSRWKVADHPRARKGLRATFGNLVQPEHDQRDVVISAGAGAERGERTGGAERAKPPAPD